MASHGTELVEMFTVVHYLSQLFPLMRTIELLHDFVRQNVHPLTATFGDRLSLRARTHYHKSQINTVRSYDNYFLITAMVESRLQY